MTGPVKQICLILLKAFEDFFFFFFFFFVKSEKFLTY